MTAVTDVRARAVAVAGLILLALLGLGARGLWETDEGRYTNVALRMLEDGDYVLPHLFDPKPHVTKPPLTYWALAASLRLGGRREWAARLPNAVAFVASVLLLWGIARRLLPRHGWLPPLIYATSPLVHAGLLFVTTDTLLALWEIMAVAGFVRAWEVRRRGGDDRSGLLQMWAGFGLAFLTKGPPGLLPLAGLLLFATLERRRGRPVRVGTWPGAALFLLLGGGWFAVVLHRHPELWRFFLGQEVVARVASAAHHRNPQWYAGPLVYGPTLLVAILPWVLLLPYARRGAGRRWWCTLAPAHWRGRPQLALPLLWFVVPLAVFMVARSRLPLYVLPLAAPLSLLLGRALARRLPDRRVLGAMTAGWVVVLLAVRFLMAGLEMPQDARRLAGEIRPLLDGPVSRVVFVNANPYYGLHFYLGAQVEPVHTSRRGPWDRWGESYRTVREVVPQDDGHWLYVVPERYWERWTGLMERMKREQRVLGRVRDKRLVRLATRESDDGD